MKLYDLENFNNDERLLLNNFLSGYNNSDITKEQVCAEIAFIREGHPDDDIVAILTDLLSKISEMATEDWNEFREYLPLPTDYEAEYINLDEELSNSP